MNMDNNIIQTIDKAISEIEEYLEKYNMPKEGWLVNGHIKVLKLLKNEILQNKLEINERVLRAFRDVSSITALHYEESIFHDSVFKVYDELNAYAPDFKYLNPLRMDFGKGNPI